jgi:hypothetical protein
VYEALLYLDLAIAAERRHQAEEARERLRKDALDRPGGYVEWFAAGAPIKAAIADVNAALAALTQHLLVTTTTTQDGAERGADGA